MKPNSLNFLTELLGTEGAKALARSVQKEPKLANLLVPRAALSWVQLRNEYEGTVPGIDNSYVKFNKSESGYNGLLTLENGNYEFAAVGAEHLAAAIAVSVDTDFSSPSYLGDVMLQRLGKSIDVLVGAQYVALKLSKSLNAALGYTLKEEEIPGGINVHAYDKKGVHVGSAMYEHDGNTMKRISGPDDEMLSDALENHAMKHTGKTMAKTDLPATTAKPRQAQGPIEPAKPVNIQRGIPKPKSLKPKLPALKVEKSEMTAQCPACGGVQFKDNKFKGCICIRDLSKSVKASIYGDGAVLEFKSDFDPEALKILRAALKGD